MGWPLDKSTLFTKVTSYVNEEDVPSPSESKEDCCFVSGLFLEGAGWDYDQGCLCKQAAKQLVYKLPITQIIPMETNKERDKIHLKRQSMSPRIGEMQWAW